MRITIAVILLLISTFDVFSQNVKTIKVNPDYLRNKHPQSELNEYYFGVKPIGRSDYTFHFRRREDGQIIDIYSNDGNSFSGQLVNEIIEYKQVKSEYGVDSKPNKYVFETLELDKTESTELGKIIIDKKLYIIPTDTLIKSWSHNWLDCGSISFEYKLKDSCYLTKYTCLEGQDENVEYVKQIKNLYDTINHIFKLDSIYSEFEKKLKKGRSYSANEFSLKYILTDKQAKRWREDAPQRSYLKSIKDTIDNYLNTELSNQSMNLNNIDCFEDYELTFGKNGKLEKVTISNFDKPKISEGLNSYRDDMKEIRKCRRLIKQIFEKINLGFLDLKYKVHRTISFDNKKYSLSDKTSY
jgi:hypothetical protein